MNDRRKAIAGIAAAAAGLATLNATAGVQRTQEDCDCLPPNSGPNAGWLPNLVVHTHTGHKAMFYKDLLLDRLVLIHFMAARNEEVYPTTGNIAKVAQLLGDRLGDDIFIYSITLDPEHDTPKVLAKLAEKHKCPPGWLFLTGTPDIMHQVHGRFFADGPVVAATHRKMTHGGHGEQDCTFGLLRYGNERVGTWGAVPARTRPEAIVQRLFWIDPKRPLKSAGRAGPVPGGHRHSRHFPTSQNTQSGAE